MFKQKVWRDITLGAELHPGDRYVNEAGEWSIWSAPITQLTKEFCPVAQREVLPDYHPRQFLKLSHEDGDIVLRDEKGLLRWHVHSNDLADDHTTVFFCGEVVTSVAPLKEPRSTVTDEGAGFDVEGSLTERALNWDALMGSDRFRVLGSAGCLRYENDGYHHIGLEIWATPNVAKNPEDPGSALSRGWFRDYVRGIRGEPHVEVELTQPTDEES